VSKNAASAISRGLLLIASLQPLNDSVSSHAAETLIGVANNRRYMVSVTDSDLKNSPGWKQRDENPPLAARDALKLAGPIKERLLKDSDTIEWHLRAVILRQNGWSDESRRWYWVVHYAAGPKPNHGMSGKMDFYVIVLMNGRIIEPVPIRRR
jgi:hypothetical protein